ncbi:hypothetical protein AGLY_007940, partial [Aphis glycines]
IILSWYPQSLRKTTHHKFQIRYRPISELSVIFKLFSNLISSKLTTYCSPFHFQNQHEFLKEFDHVNLEILFYKLQHFGFSDTLRSRFRSFLSDHFHILPKFGVPQCHHLSTLLFDIFINDLPNKNVKLDLGIIFGSNLNVSYHNELIKNIAMGIQKMPPHGSYDNILNYLNLIPLKTRRYTVALENRNFPLIDCPG